MARAQLGEIATDVQSDSGAILWSLVQGEQLELPVKLNFLTIASSGYEYEAVVIEAANIEGDDTVPVVAKSPNPVKTTLTVRVPTYPIWNTGQLYKAWEGVYTNSKYYRCVVDHTSTTFNTDLGNGYWEEVTPNIVYVQFLSTFTVTPPYTVQPTSTSAIRGFFELRVKEPAGGVFQRTWKPVRGIVEVLYSPTELVP